MPSAAEQARAMKARAMARTEAVIQAGNEAIGARIIELSPIGDPLLWERAPSGDYQPGTFVSNWNFSIGAIDTTTTDQTGIREVNGLRQNTEQLVGRVSYIANSMAYANALNWGHSSQAPVGILPIIEIEAPDLATKAGRSVAT